MMERKKEEDHSGGNAGCGRTDERRFGPVWFLPGGNNGRYPNCNSVFIEGPNIVIDPAATKERLAQIRRDYRIGGIWLSHTHEDHMARLGDFDDCPLAASLLDAPALSDIETMLDRYGVEGSTRDYWRNFIIREFGYRPRKVTRFLVPGEVIDLGTVTVEVIGTPGHTNGHLSFFFRELGILFLGDYDLSGFGPWYGDVLSSIDDTISSINTLKGWPARIWITSHEMGVFDEPPGHLWDKYVGVISTREEKLLNLLQKPCSMEEIFQANIVYWKPRSPREFFDLGECGHMAKHVQRLVGKGLVVKEGDIYVRA
jgi:glyoxylase-like metal-dependent hydrolase (beta-lactamase superfamily II)